MKERVKVDITKDAYDQIRHVNFYDVVVKLKSLKCELNLDDKTEKDHCAILDIEIPQEENQMNIDKVETQTPEEKEALDSIKPVHLRDYQKNTQTEHQEEMSAFSGEVEWKNGDECLYMNSSEMHKFIGVDPTRNDFCYIKASCAAVNWVEVAKLSKPETPQQREDRERLEAAYDLYSIDFKNSGHESFNYNQFIKDDYMRNFWIAIVDKTNYRKGVK